MSVSISELGLVPGDIRTFTVYTDSNAIYSTFTAIYLPSERLLCTDGSFRSADTLIQFAKKGKLKITQVQQAPKELCDILLKISRSELEQQNILKSITEMEERMKCLHSECRSDLSKLLSLSAQYKGFNLELLRRIQDVIKSRGIDPILNSPLYSLDYKMRNDFFNITFRFDCSLARLPNNITKIISTYPFIFEESGELYVDADKIPEIMEQSYTNNLVTNFVQALKQNGIVIYAEDYDFDILNNNVLYFDQRCELKIKDVDVFNTVVNLFSTLFGINQGGK